MTITHPAPFTQPYYSSHGIQLDTVHTKTTIGPVVKDKKLFRVLSLDAGTEAGGLVCARILQEILSRKSDLIQNTDLIICTSAGSWTGVSIASGNTLDWTIENIWTGPTLAKTIKAHFCKFLFQSLFGKNFPAPLQAYFGGRTLRSLSKPLMVTSTCIGHETSSRASKEPVPPYDVKVWSSYQHPGMDAFEVIRYSSAAPILAPVYKGNVDGGIMRLDPSMIGLMRLANMVSNPSLNKNHQLELPKSMSDVRLLSIGNGVAPLDPINGTHNWGLAPWIFDNPERLVRLFFQTNFYSTSYELSEYMQSLSGPEGESQHYARVNPTIPINLWQLAEMYLCDENGPINASSTQAVKDYVAAANAHQRQRARGQSNVSWEQLMDWMDDNWHK